MKIFIDKNKISNVIIKKATLKLVINKKTANIETNCQ